MPEKGAGRKEKEKTRKSDSFSLLLAPFSSGLRLRLARYPQAGDNPCSAP
jgi:hypothetical protein